MLKKILILLFIIILITFCLSLLKIDNRKKYKITTNNIIRNIIPIKEVKEQKKGYLEIPSIHLKEDLYDSNSDENNVEKHVTILLNEPNRIILAAHSGEGEIAYFNNINQLNKEDIIIFYYDNEIRIYQVQDITKVDKTGYIAFPKENNTLILTTCDKEDLSKQIIVRCKEKES